MCKKKYRITHRLDEVIALIQVLALDARTHRSEDGVYVSLKRKPLSAESWTTICKEHPEFFRVSENSDTPIALIASHVLPKEPLKNGQSISSESPENLDRELMSLLIRVAVDLHDKQQQRVNRLWSFYTVAIAALITAIASIMVNYNTEKVPPVIINISKAAIVNDSIF